jgi:mercuric reductase
MDFFKKIFSGDAEKSPQRNDPQTVTFEISGMTCDHCAFGIEKMLEGKKGILSKKVDYPTGKGSFSYDETATNPQDIADIINSSKNYRAELPAKTAHAEGQPGHSSNGHRFDLVIIGGGSAAFAAAIRAQDLGIKTLMVNGGLPIGGTCVNVGCVPSKILIRAGETAFHAAHSNFAGIRPNGSDIDFSRIIRDKKQLVAAMQKKKYLDVVSDFDLLTIVEGWAKFVDGQTIEVNGKDRYSGLKFLIATGASTNVPDIEGLQETGYLTTATLFDLEEKPASLTILGAGYIGLEVAMAYNRLGIKTRIIEFTDRVLRTQTPDISEELEKHLRHEGIEILPNFRIVKFEKTGEGVAIHCKKPDGTAETLVENGRIVVATGTKPNTSEMGLEKTGLALTKSGHIQVNERMETNVPHLFAAGDVTNTPAFVYTAAFEAKTAIENAFTSLKTAVDYASLPWVVFTDPQVAGAGLDEAQAAAKGIPHETSVVPLSEVPRSIVANDTRGFVKLIRNPETDLLLGARIVAPEGGELAAQLSLAIKYRIPVSDLASSFFPYLTLSEVVKLAAIGFRKDVRTLSCCAV